MSSHTPTNSDDEALSGRKVAEPLPVCPRCGSALIDQQERPGDLADDPDTVVWTQYECDSWWPDNDPSGDYSDSACELIRSLREELAEARSYLERIHDAVHLDWGKPGTPRFLEEITVSALRNNEHRSDT